jgi:type IV secretory pathway VirB3-like protein
MRLIRSPWTRAFLVWTAVLAAAAIVLAVVAVMGLLRADDACFFQVGPCPEFGDVNHVRLVIACFGIPLIWLVGVLVGAVARVLAKRDRTTPR